MPPCADPCPVIVFSLQFRSDARMGHSQEEDASTPHRSGNEDGREERQASTAAATSAAACSEAGCILRPVTHKRSTPWSRGINTSSLREQETGCPHLAMSYRRPCSKKKFGSMLRVQTVLGQHVPARVVDEQLEACSFPPQVGKTGRACPEQIRCASSLHGVLCSLRSLRLGLG